MTAASIASTASLHRTSEIIHLMHGRSPAKLFLWHGSDLWESGFLLAMLPLSGANVS